MYLRILNPTPWLSVIVCLNLNRWINDERLILDGTGDRDGSHRGGEVVLVRAKAKDSSTIVVSGGSASVQTALTTPLYLENFRDY